MTHVNLDEQPAAVREFFLNLSPGPDGSLVELNGQPVARVLPPSPVATETKDPPWTSERNRRRCELIDRKYANGLTQSEEGELGELQAAMHRFVDAIAPLPIGAARKLHQELMEKAMCNGTGS
jgi:hypothetical protein